MYWNKDGIAYTGSQRGGMGSGKIIIKTFQACVLNLAKDGTDNGEIYCFTNDGIFSLCCSIEAGNGSTE